MVSSCSTVNLPNNSMDCFFVGVDDGEPIFHCDIFTVLYNGTTEKYMWHIAFISSFETDKMVKNIYYSEVHKRKLRHALQLIQSYDIAQPH